MQVAGLTPAAATQLSASMALGRRAMGPPLVLPTKPVRSASEAVDLLSPGLRLLLEEELHVLYLDSAERPLALLSLTHGSTGNTVINAKQILRHAVQCGASAFVLAHNHPSGNPEPSLDDARATLMVMESASLLGLRLLDHLIITQTEWTSMDQLGLLGHRASGLG
jgi:DNA repair protein RadC